MPWLLLIIILFSLNLQLPSTSSPHLYTLVSLPNRVSFFNSKSYRFRCVSSQLSYAVSWTLTYPFLFNLFSTNRHTSLFFFISDNVSTHITSWNTTKDVFKVNSFSFSLFYCARISLLFSLWEVMRRSWEEIACSFLCKFRKETDKKQCYMFNRYANNQPKWWAFPFFTILLLPKRQVPKTWTHMWG